MQIKVNHVLSSGAQSQIFNDIFAYFEKFSTDAVKHLVTERPVVADIWHYHRPQLEDSLRERAVVTVHHDLEDHDGFVAFEKFAGVYRQAVQIICLCTEQRKRLHEWGYEKTIVIPHGFNRDVNADIVKTERENSEKIWLGIASRRYDRRVKGEALLLELAKRLPAEDIAFFLVGAGRSRDAALLRTLGFEVVCYEHLPYRMFSEFYSRIDALLILSLYEGGPASVPEAVASGTPVISTPVGLVRDLIGHTENGIILTRNPDIDAAMIVRFVQDRQWRAGLVAGARAHRGRALSWDDVVGAHCRLYAEMAGAR